MANPKCGSCRFFQENDLPGSGWCHHPQRKVSSDVKILVRRSELACRDDWARSLWQPTTGQAADDPSFKRPAIAAPVAPASEESLRAILSQDATVSASAGEDVLLSEGRIISENHEPWEPSSRPFPAGNFDPRTAIFRAREAFREKIRAKEAAARLTAAEASAGAFDDRGIESTLGDASDAGNVPESIDVTDQNDAAATIEDAQVMERLESAHDMPGAAFSPAEEPVDDRTRGPEDVTKPEDWTLPEPELVEAAAKEVEVCAPEPSRPITETSISLETRPATLATELPEWFRADLPRVCRACRDFRPATDGQRGWCANAWAFTHRQLVQEDDLAPCHSAIGDWWAPVDDVWLVAADVASHGRATPLLDRLISEEAGKRHRS